jgi:hypothetical protein
VLITRPEESYRLWRVVVCDLGKSLMNEEAIALIGLQGGGSICSKVYINICITLSSDT